MKTRLVVLLLLSMSFSAIAVLPDTASATTLYVGGAGPGNYTTIKAAISATTPGDTVYVYSGEYYEGVAVHWSLNLIGEARESTKIVGDIGLEVYGDWVNVSGFTIESTNERSKPTGIDTHTAKNCHIANNTISTPGMGIRVQWSENITLRGNEFPINDSVSVFLRDSSNVSLIDNIMAVKGMMIQGEASEHWNTHSIDSSNTVGGKPLIYRRNENGGTISEGAGQVILANCTGVTVENQNISGRYVGILVHSSPHTTVADSTISSSDWAAIYIHRSHNTTIARNHFLRNSNGALVDHSMDVSLTNNDAQENDETGIWLDNSDRGLIVGNVLNRNEMGIRSRLSESSTISDNTFSGNHHAIYSGFSGNHTITNNTVHLSKYDGIYVRNTEGNLIANNNVSIGGSCIELFFADNSTVINNTCSNNGIGLYITASNYNHFSGNTLVYNNYSGIRVSRSERNVVTMNMIAHNLMYGVYLDGCENNTISDNTISSNGGSGIELRLSHNNTIAGNAITDNKGYGIVLDESTDNIFIDNKQVGNKEVNPQMRTWILVLAFIIVFVVMTVLSIIVLWKRRMKADDP